MWKVVVSNESGNILVLFKDTSPVEMAFSKDIILKII